MPLSAPIHLDLGSIPFVRARNFTRTNRTRLDLIVLHSAENFERQGAARSLANWAAGVNAPKASWHYSQDAEEVIQSVRLEDVAWHAPGANHNGIGIEHCGRASQTAEDWADPYSLAMLERSIILSAALCRRYQIPAEVVTPLGLQQGLRGITTHAYVTEAFRRSTHTDPGANFPLAWYVGQVAAQLYWMSTDPRLHQCNNILSGMDRTCTEAAELLRHLAARSPITDKTARALVLADRLGSKAEAIRRYIARGDQ